MQRKMVFRIILICLSQTAQMDISSFQSLMQALEKRLEYFAEIGTMISDNGIEDFYMEGL